MDDVRVTIPVILQSFLPQVAVHTHHILLESQQILIVHVRRDHGCAA